MPREDLLNASVRYTKATLERLERVREAIKTQTGTEPLRSEALRACVEAGLPEMERKLGIEPAEKRQSG